MDSMSCCGLVCSSGSRNQQNPSLETKTILRGERRNVIAMRRDDSGPNGRARARFARASERDAPIDAVATGATAVAMAVSSVGAHRPGDGQGKARPVLLTNQPTHQPTHPPAKKWLEGRRANFHTRWVGTASKNVSDERPTPRRVSPFHRCDKISSSRPWLTCLIPSVLLTTSKCSTM